MIFQFGLNGLYNLQLISGAFKMFLLFGLILSGKTEQEAGFPAC